MMAAPAAALLTSSCGQFLGQRQGLSSAEVEKLEGYYALPVFLDLPTMKQSYVDAELDSRRARLSLSKTYGDLKMARVYLRGKRHRDVSLGELDQMADKLSVALTRLAEHVEEMDSYYTMRRELSDKGAHARHVRSKLLARFDETIAIVTPFAAGVEQAMDRQSAIELAQMQKDGRMYDYYDRLLCRKVRDLWYATATPATLDDPKSVARVDGIIAQLADLLKKDRAALATPAAKASDLGESRVAPSVEQLIGSYRDYQRTEKFRDIDHEHYTSLRLSMKILAMSVGSE
jgi:hypothetical protein